MSNKLIGIPGWSVGDNSFGASKSYMEFLSKYGDVIILPPSNRIFELDLLVLPGGKDVLSDQYGQVPSFFNSDPDLMKEFFFRVNLRHYVENETPIFGICLGMQMLNVHFGGSLTQAAWHPSSEKSRGELVHECAFAPRFMKIKSDLGIGKKFEVNSLHHQGVSVDNLSKDLETILMHDDLVEALQHKTLPIAGVQYHPEEIYDGVSDYLIKKVMNHETKRTVRSTELATA